MCETSVSVEPTRKYNFFEGRIQGVAYGKRVGNFRTDNPDTAFQLLDLASKLGIKTVFHPYCHDFSAVVRSSQYVAGRCHQVLENVSGTILYPGMRIDGVCLIDPGEACALSTGDCPTLAVSFPDGFLCVAHAGLGSIIDLEHVRSGKKSRDSEGVVQSIGRLWKGDWSEVRVAVVCGIQAHSYSYPLNHPDYGFFNLALVSHIANKYGKDCISSHTPSDSSRGCINLFKIIRAQLEGLGVDPGYVVHDNENTADGSCKWWSHCRWVKSGKKGVDGRNLAMFWIESKEAS